MIMYTTGWIMVLCLIAAWRKSEAGVGCGLQSPEYRPSVGLRARIVNGEEATPHSWPWTVVFIPEHGDLCAANLLRVNDDVEASDILMTAAHCVTDASTHNKNPQLRNVSAMITVAGVHDLGRQTKGMQDRRVQPITFYPTFLDTGKGVVDDIAIMKLDHPINFTDIIRPVCLPKQDEALPLKRLCVAAGWGRRSFMMFGNLSRQLYQIIEKVHEPETCVKFQDHTDFVQKVHLCAGSLGRRNNEIASGTSGGDSGGMLACRGDGGVWTQYGINSYSNLPDVFTKVSNYVTWIREQIKSMTSL